ncbi:unnamed protein product, partial [Schistosoma curassoni]|uniref:Reverse transcriptase domain-containing protein n=1 Tax=Schistosoma curassoni TaxID=6186 RepID=A0A183JV73_9TREM
TEHIATLRIIVEQSVEWNSSLYINFIDYEKAFDSVDRTTLWSFLRHYGVLEKIVNIIRNSYDGLNCEIVHGGKTGVRQGCLLPPFLFLLVIDWIMKTSTSGEKHGIQWTAKMQLDDLGLADDPALLLHMQQQMQEKTTSEAAASAAVGFNIHKGRSKILRHNTTCNNRITLDGDAVQDIRTFTYLGSIIDEHRGSDADVKNIWNSKQLSTNTKVRIFNTNVNTVLLYGARTWRTTKAIIQMIQLFINNCLRKIFWIRRSDTISNNLL